MNETRPNSAGKGTPRGQMTDAQKKAVNKVITETLRDFRAEKPSRRHPADVTADRLADALFKWTHEFTPAERDEASHVIHVLRGIAERSTVLSPGACRTCRVLAGEVEGNTADPHTCDLPPANGRNESPAQPPEGD